MHIARVPTLLAGLASGPEDSASGARLLIWANDGLSDSTVCMSSIGRNFIYCRVIQRDAFECCFFEVDSLTIFGILAKLLLNSLFLFYKPSEHKLSQVLFA